MTRTARRLSPHWPAVLLAVLAAGAASASDAPPREYLDEETGATVTAVDRPLVFAYPRQELAANAHDFATLAAAAVNRAGKINYVLLVYFWSTVDPRMRADSLPGPEPLALQADDRRLSLRLHAGSARDAGIGAALHAPAGSDIRPFVYATDLATLRYIAAARQLVLHAQSRSNSLNYELWDDRRGALRAFVRHMNGED